MLCFRYTSNKRLDMFLFSGPSNMKQWLRMDLHIEFRVSFDSMCVRARMSVSGGILPVDVFILLFVAHCILFL